jgi:DNA-binding NarL/FixJ family response regulator
VCWIVSHNSLLAAFHPGNRTERIIRGARISPCPRFTCSKFFRMNRINVGTKITVLIVDDHALVRRGFRRIIEDEDDIAVVGEAGDGESAVEMARQLKPRVVLMDWSLPGMNGMVAAGQITKAHPDTAVLMLSMHSEETRARQAANVGARGYIVKGAVDPDLVSAIRRVAAGEIVFDSTALVPEAKQSSTLSTRELEVLQLIVNGKSNREIAAQLDLSPNTVGAHRANIMQALHLNKTAELVLYAIRNGLAGIP